MLTVYIVHIKIYTYTDHMHRVYIQYTFPIFLTYSLIINNNNQKNILVVSSSMIINILWWSHPVFSSTSLINSSCGYYKRIKYKLIWLVMEEQINQQTHVNKVFPITSHTPTYCSSYICDMRFSSDMNKLSKSNYSLFKKTLTGVRWYELPN